MKIQVTQFMRPNGRQVQQQLDVNDSCEEKYKELTECGARLTGEQLMNGQVSQCIETEYGDFDIVITKGSDFAQNKKALEDMILRFDKEDCEKWNKRFE